MMMPNKNVFENIKISRILRDHSTFLSSRKRYESLFKLDKGDYEAWANGLKKAGYATDTLYHLN